MKLLIDNPILTTEEDKLGFSNYVDQIVEILEKNPPPFNLGILGSWGTGKTSMMNLISEQLEAKNDYETISINAWKYDDSKSIWGQIILELVRVLEKSGEASPDFRKRITGLLQGLGWVAAKKIVPSITLNVVDNDTIDSVKNVFDQFGESNSYGEYLNKFEEEFKALIKQLTIDKKLVVFIDDLDRCMPDKILNVLESLKLFFNPLHKVYFILGIDPFVVRQAIDLKYGKIIGFDSREYLEKIIHIPYQLPISSDIHKLVTDFSFETRIVNMIKCKGPAHTPRKTKIIANTLQMFIQRCGEDKEVKYFGIGMVLISVHYKSFFEKIIEDKKLYYGIDKPNFNKNKREYKNISFPTGEYLNAIFSIPVSNEIKDKVKTILF